MGLDRSKKKFATLLRSELLENKVRVMDLLMSESHAKTGLDSSGVFRVV